jgi:hypothetical protein
VNPSRDNTPTGTKALSDFISATKIATAAWARTRLSMIPAAEDNPALLFGMANAAEVFVAEGVVICMVVG